MLDFTVAMKTIITNATRARKVSSLKKRDNRFAYRVTKDSFKIDEDRLNVTSVRKVRFNPKKERILARSVH